MDFENQFSYIASIIGDKARSIMLWSLLDGRAYTASELAVCSDISPQSASNHLTKLTSAGLLVVEKQGRHRYYKLANPSVAQVIESMASLIPINDIRPLKQKNNPIGETYLRTCYDHLAGKVGVQITDALIMKGFIEPIEKRYTVTPLGLDWFKK